MAKYRKVDTRIWNDEKFRTLSDDGKLVFFFLLTHPHMTSIGAMRATVPGLAAEIGWSEERLSKAFAEALSKGMAKHDSVAALVWLPKFIFYNAPENPNVLKAWGVALDLLPECDLQREAIQAVKDFAKGLSEAFREALPKDFRTASETPSGKQEQEQEQEQEGKRRAQTAHPEWLPVDAWDGFVEMRKRIRAPLTDNAADLALRELGKLRGQGHDPRSVLEQSTMRGWRGLFAPKGAPPKRARDEFAGAK